MGFSCHIFDIVKLVWIDFLLPTGYNRMMIYEIEKTEVFDKWLRKLKDRRAVLAIVARLDRAIAGNFGDTSPVGDGISEMRIFIGPGYRLYYTIRQQTIVLMLCGGNKSSQVKDIKKAKKILKTLQGNRS